MKTLSSIIGEIDLAPKTLTVARGQLADIKEALTALAAATPAATPAARPPATPVNAFTHYKTLTGPARTAYFRANQEAIWAAFRATNTSTAK